MKNSKGLTMMTIVLGILVVVMGSYLVCDNLLKTEYDYDDVKGVYTYTSEATKDEEGNDITAMYRLYLNENGTFFYKMGTGAMTGHIGNYVIKDQTIILNYLFRTDNGTGLFSTEGSKTLTITAKDTFTDNQPSVTVGNMKNVLLKKVSPTEANEYPQYEDVSYMLNNYDLFHNTPNQ